MNLTKLLNVINLKLLSIEIKNTLKIVIGNEL
jgi:hypothetical protein